MTYVKKNKPFDFDWIDAISKVLAEEGKPMHVKDITDKIITEGYYCIASNKNPKNTVNSILSSNPNLFERVVKGIYKLKGISAPAPHTTAGRVAPVVVRSTTSVRPCTSYSSGDSEYKCAKDFIDSKDQSKLYKEEMDLLELIVNFRLPLVNGEVCFANVIKRSASLDNLKVQILDEEKSRSQLIDATLLNEKLNELNEKIAKIKRELQNNPQREELYGLLERMSSAAKEANERLDKASDGKVEFEYPILGEFIPGSNPKVVIYLKSIDESIKKRKEKYPWLSESRWQVIAGVFIHEMFHAWNYFNAGRMKRSVLAIDEPMVEFETLYFLKELEAFTKSLSHPLHENWKSRVQDKQQSIGDVAAYGFGYYLFDKLSEIDADESIKWIETYSKNSASIKSSQAVKNVEKALIPIYPFKSESKVMGWFKKIIFKGQATSKTVGKSAAAKISNTMSEVIYKIRVNRPCRLFIDDEELMTLKENELTKITLPEGEYLRKVVAEDDSTIFDEKVISLFHPKVDDIALDAISLEEAKRNALPDEIYQSNLYFKPTKDRLSVEVVGIKDYVDTIDIPNQIKYAGYVYPVIGVELSGKHDLKSVNISDSDKRIRINDCFSLTSIIIQNGVTHIGWRAFSRCESLRSITIPESVNEIVDEAFTDCLSLRSITIPNGVTGIGGNAFKGCTSLSSIIIPDSVTEIGCKVFEGCSSLTAIDYAGTKEQWKEIKQDCRISHEYYGDRLVDWWYEESDIKVVRCKDGELSRAELFS